MSNKASFMKLPKCIMDKFPYDDPTQLKVESYRKSLEPPLHKQFKIDSKVSDRQMLFIEMKASF